MDGVPNEKRSARPTKKRGAERIKNSEKSENQCKLSVIIGGSHCEKTVKKILKQVEKLCPKEIIVVINGSQDSSIDVVLSYSTYSLKVFFYPFALGEDVWRSIGAREAAGDVWLFLDANTVIRAEELQPFAKACYKGVDIALQRSQNKTTTEVQTTGTVMLARNFLNHLLAQGDLGTSSMCDVPFAITSQAAAQIGFQHLLIPPLAQAVAIEKGLRLERSHRIKETVSSEKERLLDGKKAWRELTSLGDHLEAIHYIHERNNEELI
ncbi:hypothetical protein BRE01_55740 [Brevibacillus reuszeri]|uniref:Glycosyltransferase 2-like domain-containing protein n=1 Tax=Brevibacillus reuszeri TaxID=54915 RepID=A0A0K9YP83_9BACL|nr:hypothetical protein ADS79_16115 [Brevibacillus reuszeri]GED71872.1 hypothetical protein BRE01_55740 [Brevibacillus reuszeri]